MFSALICKILSVYLSAIQYARSLNNRQQSNNILWFHLVLVHIGNKTVGMSSSSVNRNTQVFKLISRKRTGHIFIHTSTFNPTTARPPYDENKNKDNRTRTVKIVFFSYFILLCLYVNKSHRILFFKVTVYRAVRHRSNIHLTCICGFADAHSSGKVGAKVA